jgi:hypothetical protein
MPSDLAVFKLMSSRNRMGLNHEMFLPQRDLLSLPPQYAHGIGSNGCLPACSCMSTAASNAAVPA